MYLHDMISPSPPSLQYAHIHESSNTYDNVKMSPIVEQYILYVTDLVYTMVEQYKPPPVPEIEVRSQSAVQGDRRGRRLSTPFPREPNTP